MAQTDREWVRLEKTRAQFDQMVASLKRVMADYNQAVDMASDRIRILPAEGEAPAQRGGEGRTFVLQRRNAFMRLLMGSSGTIQITWGYDVPATGDRVFPEVNRLMLDTRNDWQLYRFREDKETHLERFDPDPGRLGKVLIERLVANAAIPPEMRPVLAL